MQDRFDFSKRLDGWTERRLLQLVLEGGKLSRWASFAKFVEFIRDDAVTSLTDSEKESLAEILAKKPEEVRARKFRRSVQRSAL